MLCWFVDKGVIRYYLNIKNVTKLNDMMEFLVDADIYLKTFWYIALPVSLFFIIQTIMTVMGAGDSDADVDTHSFDSPMELFTLRNMVNFLLGFSWGGISFYSTIGNKPLLVVVAILIGLSFVAMFFYLIKQIKKLEEDNTFNIEEIKGNVADVYLRIPESLSGNGKIHVSHRGTLHELDAVTDQGLIATGEKVLVLDVQPGNVVLVRRLE